MPEPVAVESSGSSSRNPSTARARTCSRCRLDDPDQVPCLRVYGLITSIAYQRARYCAERVYGAMADRFDPPLIKGMLEFEWEDFLSKERRVHGPRLFESRSGVLVWDGDYFVGDDKDLVHHIAHDFVFSFPTTNASFFLHMVTEYHEFLRDTRRLFATMEFKVGPRPVGSLMFELYTDLLPKTCENFLRLVEGSSWIMVPGEHADEEVEIPLCYVGSRVHRILREGWLQCGDVVNYVGGGGHSAMGTRFFSDEKCIVSHARRGVLSMCNEGPNSNASQFFITLAPNKWMDSLYVAFGQVVEGSATLNLLERVKTLYENPIVPIVITDCAVVDPSAHPGLPASQALPAELFVHPSPATSAEGSHESDIDAPYWDDKGAVESVVDVRDVASVLYEERFLQGLYSLSVPEALMWRAFDASREQMDEELARRLLLWLARRAAREARNAEERRRELDTKDAAPEAAARAALEHATARALSSVAASARSRLARRAAEKVVREALQADDDEGHYTLSAFLRLAAAVGEELADAIMHPLPELLSQEEAAQSIASQLLNEVMGQASKGPGSLPDSARVVRDMLDNVLANSAHPKVMSHICEGASPGDMVRDVLDGILNRAESRKEAPPVADDILGFLFGQSMDAADMREEENMSPVELAEKLLNEVLAVAKEGMAAQIARDVLDGVKNLAQAGEPLYVAGAVLSALLGKLEGPEAAEILDTEAFLKLLGEDFDPGDDAIFAYSALIAREILKKARADADEKPWAPIIPLFDGLRIDTMDTEPLMEYEKEELVRNLLQKEVVKPVAEGHREEIPLSRTARAGVVRGLLTQDILDDVVDEAERQAKEAFRQRVLQKAKDILQGAFELVAEIQWAAADVAFKYGVRTALPPSHIGFPPGDVRLLPPLKTWEEQELDEKFDMMEKARKERSPLSPQKHGSPASPDSFKRSPMSPDMPKRKFDPVYRKEKPPWPPAIPGDDPSYYHPGLTAGYADDADDAYGVNVVRPLPKSYRNSTSRSNEAGAAGVPLERQTMQHEAEA